MTEIAIYFCFYAFMVAGGALLAFAMKIAIYKFIIDGFRAYMWHQNFGRKRD